MERGLLRHGGMAARRTAKRAHHGSTDSEERGTRASGRGIWSGSISFGLLQIPVTLYSAERRDEEIHFRQLDKKDLAPIKYERVSSATGKAVEWKNIVKGYEYKPDTFVVLEPDDLKQANVKATQTVDIQDFVPFDQIDPAFFETPYYLVPNKRAAKAYILLREALKKKEAAAVATFVLRTREHLCCLIPVGDAIMLEVLRFGHELKQPKDLPLPTETAKESNIGAKEMAMAEQLIEGMMSDWDPKKYKDRFHDDVMKMIEEKAKTGKVTAHNDKPHGEVANDVVDLLELLKKSVARGGGSANDSHAPKRAGKTAAKGKKRSATKTRATRGRSTKKKAA